MGSGLPEHVLQRADLYILNRKQESLHMFTNIVIHAVIVATAAAATAAAAIIMLFMSFFPCR